MPIQQPVVYCPIKDEEFSQSGRSLTYFVRSFYPTPLFGGEQTLGDVHTTARLYLMVHAYYQMGKFWSQAKMWTAEEMAEQLESDGLSRNHRDLEMLVCCAGLSPNKVKSQENLEVLWQAYLDAEASGDKEATKKAADAFTKAEKKAAKPAVYNGGAKQVLPLVCQLVAALKERNYANLRVTAYKVPVATTFIGGSINLDLTSVGGQYATPINDPLSQAQKVVWL
jgi:hypothetical protein